MSSNPTVLVVEDNEIVQSVVRGILETKYAVTSAMTFADAILEFERQKFSLVILDIELPDGSGLDLCTQIRRNKVNAQTPIIFLSGRGQPMDKVTALSLGGDDYIVKPVEPLEFQARIEAHIRRFEALTHTQGQVTVGPFRAVLDQYRVYIATADGDGAIDLTPIEFKLLVHFLKHEGQVFTREQIIAAVWGLAPNVTVRTVDSHIYTLRRKLGAAAGYIHAVPRVGYQFRQFESKSA